jgi:SEC-C motif
MKLGRNEPCWCGSGKKYKKCHLDRENQPPVHPWEVDAFIRARNMRIPMMSISHSDLMPIRSERSDAGLFQCEIVIGISQDFSLFSLSRYGGFSRFPGCLWFWALTEGARRATGVSAQNHSAVHWLFRIFAPTTALLLPHGFSL